MKRLHPADLPTRGLLRFSVEDRFIILRFWEKTELLPTSRAATTLAHILGFFTPSYSLICDVRSAKAVTNDMIEFLRELQPFNPLILASRDNAHWISYRLSRYCESKWASDRVLSLRHNPPRFKLHDFPPLPMPSGFGFMPESEWPQWREAVRQVNTKSPPSLGEYRSARNLFRILHLEDEIGAEYAEYPEFSYEETLKGGGPTAFELEGYNQVVFAIRWLAKTIPLVARQSLLTQFMFEAVNRDTVVTTPYHGHAAYNIEIPEGLLIGRPSVIAGRTQSLLSSEIEEFSVLLSSHPKELDIQKFLEKHTNILHSLGYLKVCPQIVLARDDGTSLRPDFILQPLGEEWCDILDIKLPDNRVIVGGRDRKTLAASIHELAAQLREYAAYFENPVYAKRIEEKYGLKCYRPRLMGVVGRSENIVDELQARRLMTAYDDINIMTFDRLIAISKNRILI
jgi:hypothetical protein